MKKHLKVSIILTLILSLCTPWILAKTDSMLEEREAGPIPIRNQMPLYLFYLQMEPDSANITEKGKFNINADYTVSNITVSCFTPATSLYNINIDAEVSRITLDLRYGFYDKSEIGLEIPYLSLSRGYLDGFVEEFEKTVGATTPRSRARQGSYSYNYSFIYNNENLISKKHSSEGLGDVVLKSKYRIVAEDKYSSIPNVSLRAAIKFPTGSKKDLMGSGEFDYGLGVISDKSFFKRLRVYCGLNAVFIKKPSFFSVLGIKKEIFSGLIAVEYFFRDRFSLVAQVTGNSTPYPSSGTNALDESAIDAGMGLNYNWKEKRNVSWHFAFTENFNSASSPDVSFNTGWKIGF